MKKYKSGLIIKVTAYVIVAITFIQCANQGQKENIEQKVQQIIDSMSLEQKAKLLIGTGMYFELPDSIAAKFPRRKKVITDTAYEEMVNKIRKNLPGAAGFTAEFPELGINTMVHADGPAGLRIAPKRKGDERTYYCTAFPVATLLASTWDTELVYNVGEAMGNEVLEYNADILLGPAMNLQRDPLCGRNFEYYSEDPLVTGKMAAAMAKGVQSNGVGVALKHFAANNQETNRLSVNTIASERALREIYLRGFEIAVTEAQPWTVMSSYNKINGEYTSERHDLLTEILRNEWGFEGYVMTDWGAGSDVVEQMAAGNDLIMPGRPEQVKELINAVTEGKLEENILDKNLSRILTIMMRSPKQRGYEVSNNPNLNEHAVIARKAAARGMVLLENRGNALPIPQEIKNAAVFGVTSYEFISGGKGSGDVNEAYTISLIEGLTNSGLVVNNELTDIYSDYIKETRAKEGKPKNWWIALMGIKEPVPEMDITDDLAYGMAKKSDIAIITIGRHPGEGKDLDPVEGDFYLTDTEKMLIENVSAAFHSEGKKAIVILNIGNPVEIASWKEDPDAILCAWHPGQEAGNSIVDVLTGKVNPSGKLAVTFPISYNDSPTAKNFPGVEVKSDEIDDTWDTSKVLFVRRIPWEVVYEEDIYVGYRYYTSFEVPVAYEFGYGLSYTSFEYSKLKLSSSKFKRNITLKVDVKNSGEVPGSEVVQVYLSAPASILEKPAYELVAFNKTKLLAPGEVQAISFTIEPIDLCSFDESISAWVAEPGKYEIKIGASSLDIKETASFTLDEERIVKTVTKALTPKREINKLSTKK